MLESEAPIRLYQRPNGRKVVWEEDLPNGERPIPWNTGGTEMKDPDPTWKLLKGFRTLRSFEDYLKGTGLKIKMKGVNDGR